jgi:hypothetical protein
MILISDGFIFFVKEQVLGSQLPTRNRQIHEKWREGMKKFSAQDES